MASIRKNFLLNATYQTVLVLTPLVTTPYLARTIGASGNGLFTYSQSVANYFVLFASLGISNHGIRAVAECGENRALRSKVFWEAWLMIASVGVVSLISYAVYVLLFQQSSSLVWWLWLPWIVGTIVDVTWLLFGMQDFLVPTLRSLATRIVSVIVIFTYVKGPDDVWAYVLAISSPYLVNSLLIWPFVSRYIDWYAPTFSGMRSHFVPCLSLFVPILATSVYTLFDKVMLGSMTTLAETGIFDYAEKITKMPMSVVTAMGAVVLPRMSSELAEGRMEEARHLIKLTMWFMQACAIALAFGIAAVAPEFCLVFFGPNYERCIPLIRILCVTIPTVCATNVLGMQWLIPTHRDRAFTSSVIGGAIVNLLMNTMLIGRIGALGATISTVAAEFVVLGVQTALVRKELNVLDYLQASSPFVAIGMIMLACVRIAARVFVSKLTLGILLLGEILIGALIYITFTIVFCVVTRNPYFTQLFPAVLSRKTKPRT